MNAGSTIDPSELPALRDLHRASAAIAVVAAVLAVTVVLPAERGVDPTGIGDLLGLTALGELKQGAGVVAPASDALVFEPRTDEITLTLESQKGSEVKATMRAGDRLTYSWTGGGGIFFYDFHGEPDGAASDVFTSFEKGTKASAEGEFTAPFDGVHGWYWKNVGTGPATIELKTQGVYAKIRRID